jgi:glucose-6-phosphate isomerase
MNYTKLQWWERFQKYYTEFPELGLAIDLTVDDAVFEAMVPRIQKVFTDLDALEKGAIANPDENRMVGHYWLRNPELAPTPEIRVDGRTRERSAVGFLPAALQGISIDGLLASGQIVDFATRRKTVKANPAAQLAPAWFT